MPRLRRLAAVAALVAAIVAVPQAAGAHGIGGRSDLPVPLEYFLVGAGIVLLVSFGLLALLWPSPRLQQGARFRGRGVRIPLGAERTAGFVAVGWLILVVVAGLAGDREAASNAAPVSVWVVFWLVLPFLAAVLGNFWARISPWVVLGRWVEPRSSPAGSVDRLGVWPAVLAFGLFTWLELVYADSGDPRMLAIAAVVYSGYVLAWSARIGVEATSASVEAFAVYHRLIGGLAPLGRDDDGRLRRRGWLRGVVTVPERPGLVAFVIAMIGTVTYDGLSQTPWWDDVSFALVGTAQRSEWFGTLAMASIVVVLGAAYLAASWWASRIAADAPWGPTAIARSFAHTLVPIALAYAVAHYLTLIFFEGQLLFAAVSDPLGRGWDLFGTAGWEVNYTWISPTVVWYLQVGAIVAGHVAGVILAHDRALAIFPAERAVRTQYAMLVLMVGLTALGLTILAAG
jgi:hypothetical protein